MSKHFKWRKPKPTKNQPSPNQKDAERRKESSDQHVVVAGGIEIDLGHNLREQRKTEYDETTTQNKKQLRWTIITTVLIFIYAGVTFWQGCTTRQLAKIAKDQLTYSQRAWVGFDEIRVIVPPPWKVAEGNELQLVATTKNYGTTPATRVAHKLMVNIFCGNFPADPPYDNRGINSAGSFMPGQPNLIGPAALSHKLSKDEVESVTRKDSSCGIYVYSKIEYCDIFNIRHYRHFCVQWQKETESAFMGCSVYNDGDEDYSDEKAKKCESK